MRAEWLSRVEHLGDQGLRVLGCAMKTGLQADAAPYEGLTFIGLVGLEDPARADVPPAVQKCREAGVRVAMVTGDHAVTARSIARAVGLGDGTILEGKQVEGFL
jgi:Ca2+-transporting ATPase